MRLALSLSSIAMVLLTGCAFGPSAPLPLNHGVSIRGVAFGGHQPIVGSHVYLMAAGTTGYGLASVSLLDAAATGFSDSVGAYVTTGNYGEFSISNDYTCTPGAEVYLLVLGGNPGSGENVSIGLMSVLGDCPDSESFADATPFLYVNELSTIAAAYSFAGFATDALHVASSGTDQAKLGIRNAFANASNLVDVSTGSALSKTSAANGANGVVPQTRLNALGNILAACVNTDSRGSTPCSTLFTNTKNAAGTAPTETATAAINLAHFPGTGSTAGVTALFNMTSSTPPFLPALTSAPKDYVIGIKFAADAIANTASIAIDAKGNAWLANSISLAELAPGGALLSGADGFGNGTLLDVENLAIDPTTGVIWTADAGGGLEKFSSEGVIDGNGLYNGVSGSANLRYYMGLSIDLNSNVWVSLPVMQLAIDKFNSDGSLALVTTNGSSGYYILANADGTVWSPGDNLYLLSATGDDITPAAIANNPDFQLDGTGTALDASGNVWMSGQGTLYAVSPTGPEISPVDTGYTGGGQDTTTESTSMAIDGDGNVWTANYEKNTVTVFSSARSKMISTSSGFGSGTITHPEAVAVDPSGNVWVATQDNGFPAVDGVVEIIGVAAPVVTPLTPGKYGTRP